MTVPTKDAVVEQIDAILKQLRDVVGVTDNSGDLMGVGGLNVVKTRALATLARLAPAKSPYLDPLKSSSWEGEVAIEARDALIALKADVEAGYVETLEALVHAEVFADFLEMAQELQIKGFKDPAAVIAGSVLEEHLRKLAAASGINPERGNGSPKKADTINAELAKAQVYNKLQQKQITAWLDLRNKAAHGEYDEYDHQQVTGLIRDVRNFLIKYPA
jgi:acetolactate synthase small subunit